MLSQGTVSTDPYWKRGAPPLLASQLVFVLFPPAVHRQQSPGSDSQLTAQEPERFAVSQVCCRVSE